MISQRTRILHIYKDYWPPIVGGIEKTIHYLAHGFADSCDVAALVCARRWRGRMDADGPVRLFLAGEWRRFASAPLAPAFPLWIRRWKADILHFHHPNPTGELSWLVSRPLGRVVVTYHSDIVRQRIGLRLYGPLLRRFLAHACAIMPTSPNYIESSEFLRPLASRCTPVPLGIPLDAFDATPKRLDAARRVRERLLASGGGAPAPPGTPILVFVGQFREYKGLPFLLDALAGLRARGVDFRAALIGGGPMRPQIEAQRSALGLADIVHLPGRLSDEDVTAHLHACDVFVLPSHRRSEAFGIAQIEAMACGKPVVSTRLDTGVPYVNRHEETGLIVEPANATALADGLGRLLRDPALRLRLGEAARRRARAEFSVERMIERVGRIYETVLARPLRRD